MKKVIAQQGEVLVIKLDTEPQYECRPFSARTDGTYLLSHSEQGHHHVLTGGEVMERVEVPTGMQIFRAAIANAEQLVQEKAATPHAPIDLEPGWYEFRISREYNPFIDEARRVAD